VRGLQATFLRELRAYFVSPLAYLVMFFFLIYNGAVFAIIMSYLNNPAAPGTERPMDNLFQGFFFWVLLLFLCTVLTMRLISEELRSGSIEVLMTAPVTEAQVVTGKYLAALTFYCALWAPTVAYAGIVARYSHVDWGPIGGGYLGIFLIGAMFLAVGVLFSALTKSQLLAAIMTFAVLFLLFVIGLLENLFNGDSAKQALGYVDLYGHMEELHRGIIDSRHLIYYGSAIFFFLFLASRALADRKWR
jgi:gliding motility-associated transport system permease protein